METPTLTLIAGPPGCGESTLGNAIGRRLNACIIDLDTVSSEFIQPHLEAFFQSEFGLVRLVTTPPSVRPDRLSVTLAAYARNFLETVLPDEPLTIGFGWGTTMYQVAHAPSQVVRAQWRIVPVSGGSSRISDKHSNISHIIHSFAESCRAQANPVYLPFWAEHLALETIKQSEEYTRTMQLWQAAFIRSKAFSVCSDWG